MSAALLKDINERLAKMPFLGGYEISEQDKKVLGQLDQQRVKFFKKFPKNSKTRKQKNL